MSEHAPDRLWSGIDITKTLAGALAAVCAAVIGSFLGVAGTLIGAALASVIGTVGTEIYNRGLLHGRKKLETIAPTFVKAPAAVGTPEVAAATEEDKPSDTVIEEKREGNRKFRWGHVALAAGALFVLAMGSLTVVELFAGKSVASMVGNNAAGRTTISTAVTGDSGDTREQERQQPAPAESGDPASTPGTDEEGGTTPTDAPSSTPAEEPGTTPAEEPTATTPGTEAPATEAPREDATPGTDPGGDSGTDTGSGGGSGESDQQQEQPRTDSTN